MARPRYVGLGPCVGDRRGRPNSEELHSAHSPRAAWRDTATVGPRDSVLPHPIAYVWRVSLPLHLAVGERRGFRNERSRFGSRTRGLIWSDPGSGGRCLPRCLEFWIMRASRYTRSFFGGVWLVGEVTLAPSSLLMGSIS
jgi:hypothetical protein